MGFPGLQRTSALARGPIARSSASASQRHPSDGLQWTYTGVAPAARIGPSKKKQGAGTTTSSPGRTRERKQIPRACMAPFVTTISVSGSTARPVDRSSAVGERLAQADETARRRRGHRAPQHRRDGLDDVVRERRGRRAGERDRLDACRARLLERPLGLVRGEATVAGHDAVTGRRTCDG